MLLGRGHGRSAHRHIVHAGLRSPSPSCRVRSPRRAASCALSPRARGLARAVSRRLMRCSRDARAAGALGRIGRHAALPRPRARPLPVRCGARPCFAPSIPSPRRPLARAVGPCVPSDPSCRLSPPRRRLRGRQSDRLCVILALPSRADDNPCRPAGLGSERTRARCAASTQRQMGSSQPATTATRSSIRSERAHAASRRPAARLGPRAAGARLLHASRNPTRPLAERRHVRARRFPAVEHRTTAQETKKNRRLNEAFYVGRCGFGSASFIKAGFQVVFFFREVHPASEMARTRRQKNDNGNFQTMTNRGDSQSWGGAMRGACDPTHSSGALAIGLV